MKPGHGLILSTEDSHAPSKHSGVSGSLKPHGQKHLSLYVSVIQRWPLSTLMSPTYLTLSMTTFLCVCVLKTDYRICKVQCKMKMCALVQKFFRISRRQEQSLKPSLSPEMARVHAQKAGPASVFWFSVGIVPSPNSVTSGGTWGRKEQKIYLFFFSATDFQF